VGAINVAHQELCIGRGLAAIRFPDNVSRFGYHALASAARSLRRVAQGTTFEAVGGAELRALLIPGVSASVADRIADILDTVDDAIRQTERVIAKLEQVKSGMLQDLLTRGIDDNREVRDPDRHPEQFKDSPLGRIPENWDVLSLRECAEPQGFFDGDWIEAPDLSATGIRLIQTGNVGIGRFEDRPDFRRFISPATFRRLNCSWVRPGDVLICRLAEPIGRACVVPPHVGDSVTAVDCTVFRGGSKVDRDFVVAVLNSAPSLRRAQDQSGGTTRQRIGRSSLGRLPLPLPPRQEQRCIADILDQHQDRVLREGEALAKFRATKQAISDDLLTGRVRVNTREGVPA
jgi:type I restriction enzyme S subunit